MKKRNLLFLLIPFVLILASCGNSGKGEPEGEKLTARNFKRLADSLMGQTVVLEGYVLHTCKHGGKRMFIVEKMDDTVAVEVTTGPNIAKFDEALVGSRVRVAGFIREERIDAKYLNEWEAEVMKEQGGHQTGIHTGQKGHEDASIEDKLNQINYYRSLIAASESDHVSNYSLEAATYSELK